MVITCVCFVWPANHSAHSPTTFHAPRACSCTSSFAMTEIEQNCRNASFCRRHDIHGNDGTTNRGRCVCLTRIWAPAANVGHVKVLEGALITPGCRAFVGSWDPNMEIVAHEYINLFHKRASFVGSSLPVGGNTTSWFAASESGRLTPAEKEAKTECKL